MKYYGAVATDMGNVKRTNQDSACLKIADAGEYGKVVMAMICDGMGGLDKGEVASASVIRAFSDWFEQTLPLRLEHLDWHMLSEEWKKIIREQNYRILMYGKRNSAMLGTTLSGILMIDDAYMIAHVGDSRIYELNREICQLTEDQTYVAREIKWGHMTPEEAKTHPKRNMLLQCVGASGDVVPEMHTGNVKYNSVFLLCSDGFRHVLSSDELYEAFCPADMHDPDQMAGIGKQMIEKVKQRNERDNISVIFIKCEE